MKEREMFAAVRKHFGKLNILVCSDEEITENIPRIITESIRKNFRHFRLKAPIVTKLQLIPNRTGLSDLKHEVRMSDIVFFDYGGLGGYQGLGYDRWNKEFFMLIVDHPSKIWMCTSALPTFDSRDKGELENLGVKFTSVHDLVDFRMYTLTSRIKEEQKARRKEKSKRGKK